MALMDSVGAIINVLIVILMIWIMFSILGISLLGERMGYCDIGSFYHVNKENCLIGGNIWRTYPMNFNHILHALNSLFVLSTQEGWPSYMY